MRKRLILIFAIIPSLCVAQWTQIGDDINGLTAGDNNGWSTAISADGSIVAIGSIFNANAGNAAGQVRVYRLSNNVWSQIGADINGETGGDQTGQSVSLSDDGSVLAIGEPFNNDLGFTSGQVRVFRNVNDSWIQVGQDLYGQNAVASAGTSVDLSADGNTVAFGAPNTLVSPFTSFTGNVEVYQLQENTWVQKGVDIDGDGSIIKFGQSLSLSEDGNIVAISQTGDPSNLNESQIGRVKVYQFQNNQWIQVGNTIFGQAERDEFGWRVRLSASGSILAISSAASNVVVVYQLIDSVWTQIADALFGENAGDLFGYSIDLTKDGSTLAVGGRWNSIDGFRRGRAYVFKYQGGNWEQIENAIVGVADNDHFGFSIAISENGSRIAVGAINNDDSGNNAGQVRVFENSLVLKVDNYVDVENEINVYPNPSTDIINIHSKQIINKFILTSFDGKILNQNNRLNEGNFNIDIQKLPAGLYTLTMEIQGKKSDFKIVKN